MEDADLCRMKGWKVGQRLVGDEGYGPTTIEITAIGVRNILAKAVGAPRGDDIGSENLWSLAHRDWQPVDTTEKEQCMSKDEAAVEAEIVEKGLTAKRITPGDLENEITAENYHVFPGTCLTVCCLTLKNGFNVIGESACASPENFDAGIGRKIAFANAREKIWPLLGFRLRDQLSV